MSLEKQIFQKEANRREIPELNKKKEYNEHQTNI